MTFPGVDVGIDAAAEQIVEIRIEGVPPEERAADLIPRKSRQVADIKYERMPPYDRTRIQLRVWDNIENPIGALPRGEKIFAIVLDFAEYAAFYRKRHKFSSQSGD
jgi:hypothetical protein